MTVESNSNRMSRAQLWRGLVVAGVLLPVIALADTDPRGFYFGGGVGDGALNQSLSSAGGDFFPRSLPGNLLGWRLIAGSRLTRSAIRVRPSADESSEEVSELTSRHVAVNLILITAPSTSTPSRTAEDQNTLRRIAPISARGTCLRLAHPQGRARVRCRTGELNSEHEYRGPLAL
jgi:hypothetical protein